MGASADIKGTISMFERMQMTCMGFTDLFSVECICGRHQLGAELQIQAQYSIYTLENVDSCFPENTTSSILSYKYFGLIL